MKRNEAWLTSAEELNRLLTEDERNEEYLNSLAESEFENEVTGHYNFVCGLLMGSFDMDDEQLSEEFIYFLVTSNLNPFELGLDECRALYIKNSK